MRMTGMGYWKNGKGVMWVRGCSFLKGGGSGDGGRFALMNKSHKPSQF